MANRRKRNEHNPHKVPPIIRLWLLRILVTLGVHREFVQVGGLASDALAEAVGLGHWIATPHEFDQIKAQLELRRLHLDAEKNNSKATVPACLNHNITELSALVNLSPADCRILEFAISIQNERMLDETAHRLGTLSSVKVFHALSVILALPETDIRASLDAQGTLANSGLLSMDRSAIGLLCNKLNLLSDKFADRMASATADPIVLLRGVVSAAPPGQLCLADYAHIENSLEILHPYLRHATATRRRGVNIFLHGAPGTGKSQLARALADELECKLFEIPSEDEDGAPVTADCRLRAFRTAQSFFAQRRAMVVFDEVEDVFNDGDGFLGRKSTAQVRKAWMNRMLEENPVPALWLSNSIHGLDPAFIRRFDMVIELPVPPKKQRVQILQDSCSDLLDTSQITRIADADSLAPAVVARASAVVRSIRDELGQKNVGTALERLISSTLEAQGHRRLLQHDPNRLPEVYDPRFIHTDADLAVVSAGLISARTGRLCLYGPPGTGKTAYGRWIAEQLGVPLLVKRASDLKSKWLGESEKNIAQAFQESENASSVLLIDEVDSFLQDRRGAQRSWEVSEVNEMLTQMESFSGLFIASTNLMEGLDQAALRRFDLKVKFDFLRPDQAWDLLCRHCAALGLDAPMPELQSTVTRMQQLTPGDFATVLRQHRFRPIASAAIMVAALEGECAVKEVARRAIGFR